MGKILSLLILLSLYLITSCSSTKPSPYQEEKDDEGFSDSTFKDMRVATFKGNSYTEEDTVQLFAQFRAIEVCTEEARSHANIIDVFDRTIRRNITRTSGSSWGPSYYGMYPYYSRHSSFGLSAGFNTINSNSWNETLVYPIYDVLYTCATIIHRPGIIFKEITANQMKHLVHDVKGGIQVENFQENSPNKKRVELGDIILKANGHRIEKVYELIGLFKDPIKQVSVTLLREGKNISTFISAIDITSQVVTTEEQIINKVCNKKDDKKQKNLRKNKLCHEK